MNKPPGTPIIVQKESKFHQAIEQTGHLSNNMEYAGTNSRVHCDVQPMSESQTPRSLASPRFSLNNFDLLRILAATQVLYFHTIFHLKIDASSWSLVFKYFPGVPIFFVISGYLVSASYERSESLTRYFWNRFLRIYPGLWVCLVLTVIVALGFGFDVLHLRGMAWIATQMAGLIYTPVFLADFGFGSYNGSLWTIPIELQFYCVLPLVYLLAARAQPPNLVFLILLAIFVFISFFCLLYLPNADTPGTQQPIAEKLFNYSFLRHFSMFMAGVVLQRLGAYKSKLVFGKGVFWIAGYLLFCYMVPSSAASVVVSQLILAVCIVSLAYTLPDIANKLLRGNDISYGVYIYHGLIINIMVSMRLFYRTEYLLIVWVGTYLAGYLSWVLVERKFLRRKREKLKTFAPLSSWEPFNRLRYLSRYCTLPRAQKRL
jgi:peptidoglycan/LPS O-acetylase OafA/YrhL